MGSRAKLKHEKSCFVHYPLPILSLPAASMLSPRHVPTVTEGFINCLVVILRRRFYIVLGGVPKHLNARRKSMQLKNNWTFEMFIERQFSQVPQMCECVCVCACMWMSVGILPGAVLLAAFAYPMGLHWPCLRDCVNSCGRLFPTHIPHAEHVWPVG